MTADARAITTITATLPTAVSSFSAHLRKGKCLELYQPTLFKNTKLKMRNNNVNHVLPVVVSVACSGLSAEVSIRLLNR